MALSSFQLFMSQAQNAPTELKVQVLRIILDLLIVYDQEFFSRSEDVVSFLLNCVNYFMTDYIFTRRPNGLQTFCFRCWILMIHPKFKRFCVQVYANFCWRVLLQIVE